MTDSLFPHDRWIIATSGPCLTAPTLEKAMAKAEGSMPALKRGWSKGWED